MRGGRWFSSRYDTLLLRGHAVHIYGCSSNLIVTFTEHGESFARSSLPVHKYGAINSVERAEHNIFGRVIVDVAIFVSRIKALIWLREHSNNW